MNNKYTTTTYLIALLLTCSPIAESKAQSSIEYFESKIKSLQSEISVHQDSIKLKRTKIDSYKDSISVIKVEQNESVWLTAFRKKVYRLPDIKRGTIETIYRGAEVRRLDTLDQFVRVRILDGLHGYNGSLVEVGYIEKERGLFSNELVAKLTASEILDSIYENKVDRYEGISERLKEAIKKGEVYIGMERKWVIEIMGYPDEINKTTTQYSVSEQFVYENPYGKRKYLYIDDGKLTVIQE